ncbi:MAG: protein kinase [Planctomycetota bacterium]
MKLDCPKQPEIRSFLEGDLDDSDARRVSIHVDDCPTCSAVVGEMENEQAGVLTALRDCVEANQLLREREFEELRNTVQLQRDETTPQLDEEPDVEPGKRLRDYRLVKKIGEGGMGTVYQALHVHLGKPVALKVLPGDMLQHKQSVRRFRQEMRAVGRVNHPNVVSASDAGSVDGQHFLVMELVRGADLARITRDHGPLSVPDACEIVRQAAIGLQHAHDSGLVHRDVKPSNAMLDVNGTIKLLDLGLASLNNKDLEETAGVVVSGRLTSVGQIMGTLDYMAPEQLTGDPNIDGKADIYALGATLFQLLTGRTPCGDPSESTPQRIEAVLSKAPREIMTLRKDVPEPLRALLQTMLAKSPNDRPQTARRVAEEIAVFASEADLLALADTCNTSLDLPSADVDVTDDASFLVSRLIEPEEPITPRKPRIATGIFGAAFALIAAVAYFIVTNNGVVKVEVLDESFQASINGQLVTIRPDGESKPMTLRPGDHRLIVSVGETELITNEFEMRRNDEIVFRVSLLEGNVVISRDGNQVSTEPMPQTEPTTPLAGIDPIVEATDQPKQTTLADLPSSDIALIYQLITGVELGGPFAADAPSESLAGSVNVLLDFDTISREQVAKKLVELEKPDVAKVLLADGRVDAPAAEALKMGDLLLASGNGDKAVDAYLEAFRLAPHLFMRKYLKTFEEHGRLKDLAELYTEERLRMTRAISEQNSLLERLMEDDTRASIGMPYMARAWNARPDLRTWIIDEVPWDEVPDRFDYFRPLIIPTNIDQLGTGYGEMFDAPDVQGGWLYDLRNILDAETARQLIAEVTPLIQEHPTWLAGSLMLAILESKTGNLAPAKRWIEHNVDTVQTYRPDSDRDLFLAHYAEFVGGMLQGNSPELDLLVIRLYEQAIEHRCVQLPYRETKVDELAKLYQQYGRSKEAVDLMAGLVGRQRDADEYLVNNWGKADTVNLDHERLWDLRTAVETLNRIDRPMDALSLLSRIDFDQRRAAGEYKGGGYRYDDDDLERATNRSRNSIHIEAIVEAFDRGILPIGLSSKLNKSGAIDNPIFRVLRQVAHDDISDETMATFDRIRPELTDADVMDRHLAEMTRQQPADSDVAVAAAIFAFLRDDTETARKRLELVIALFETDSALRASDVGLCLVAELARGQHETAKYGETLFRRAANASEQMNDEWKRYFQKQSEEGQSLDDASKTNPQR